MKTFYCRVFQHNPWIAVKTEFAEEAAEQFGADQKLNSGYIVHVKNHGSYRLSVHNEPEYHADKIK